MTAISIGKTMNPHELMMKTGGKFLRRAGLLFFPIFHLTAKDFQFLTDFRPMNADVFIGFSIFSCLMVTKDEFIHKEHCPGAENWLHALLFLLHPITLAVTGMIWPISQGVEVSPWMMSWLDNPEALRIFLILQTAAIALFFSYQLIFWNFIWKNRPVIKF